MAAKKPAKRAMSKKSMKRTKGGLLPAVNVAVPSNGMLLPAVQKIREAAMGDGSA
jgi:hypothetical protein